MTEEFRREAERALSDHDAFEHEDEGFGVTTTPFEATVRVSASDSGVDYRVTVRVPTINAVVAGEEVGPAVREGWFETFERRMEDVGAATLTDPPAPDVRRDAAAAEVVVDATVSTDVASRGVEDARAVVDYVEGTYMEGVIPGYAYREPVAGMIERARDRSQGAGGPPL